MKADYGAVDRLLHRVALRPATARVFHELERNRYLRDAPEDKGGHVFVTGLARAGTTILLRELHASGRFGSLLYADMPFVLAPNLWASISGGARKTFAAVERAHGDGIAISLDSPEAFDEVFWRVFHGASYIRADGLLPHQPGPKAVVSYREFIRLVLRRRRKGRYLAKGNNNILRLAALASALSDSTFLLVIREPLAHAESLLRQHLRSAGDKDPFRRDYMKWLVHHEFGSGHRPFRFPGCPDGNPNALDYWLATWLACYSALEPVVEAHPNIVVVPHEQLCAGPRTWTAVCNRLGLDPTALSEIRARTQAVPESKKGVFVDAAEVLYARYLERSIR